MCSSTDEDDHDLNIYSVRLFVSLTESLSDNASAFSSRAKQLHRRMWWRDMKVGLCVCVWGWVIVVPSLRNAAKVNVMVLLYSAM